MDRYYYLNSSNMNFYFNFDKLNMLNHMAYNNYCFDNNHWHITKNKFIILILISEFYHILVQKSP